MKHLVWIGADGVEWPLSGHAIRGVFVEHGGIGEIVGRREVSTTSLVGVPGAGVVDGQIPAIEFNLTLVFADSTKYGEHGDVEELWHDFFKGCSQFQTGVLRVADSGREVLDLPCLVKSVPVLPTANKHSGALRGEVSFLAPKGVWELPRFGTGSVKVVNHGDVHVWPKIRWKGAGGEVVLPSGATFTLPPVASWRTLNFDPATSCEVVDDHGVLDAPLWRQVRSVFVEGVPTGGERLYRVPDGAELLWRIGVLNPWR